jgi:hypothetical protein
VTGHGSEGGTQLPPALRPEALLRAIPSPALVLDPELTIVGVNPAHLAVAGRERDDVVGRHVFDAFPADPTDAGSVAGQEQLRASFEHVISTRAPHRPVLHRHDVQVPGDPARFERRYWSSSNSPILDADGELVGILHVVDEVTGFHEHLRATVDLYLAEIRSQGRDDDESAGRFARYVQVAMEHSRRYAEVSAEVDQLREALTSRATIEQAKGMLMFERGIGPDDAFAVLVRASQQANVKVRDLARTMVERVRGRTAPWVS